MLRVRGEVRSIAVRVRKLLMLLLLGHVGGDVGWSRGEGVSTGEECAGLVFVPASAGIAVDEKTVHRHGCFVVTVDRVLGEGSHRPVLGVLVEGIVVLRGWS